jgi:crotonobetainyl-CoA:carnitine CoA-transferase CaiB-like acyl-CoA transferase
MQALEGIKVVELGGWVVGPAVAAVLGDWGADVIKIEDPAGGDPLRGLEQVAGRPAPKKYMQHDVANRSKRSIALDLKIERGRELAYEMRKKADVFVTNFREDALKRVGMDYETLSRLNPRLIYAFVSGYGEKGPDRNKAAFDLGAYCGPGAALWCTWETRERPQFANSVAWGTCLPDCIWQAGWPWPSTSANGRAWVRR